MITHLPVDRLYHPGVVVRDARATARSYAEIFGIDRWTVTRCGPQHLGPATTHGRPSTHSFTSAFGFHEGSGLLFQLIEPGDGDASTFAEFLATRGEGIHNLCTTIVTPEVFAQLRDLFSSKGVFVGQSDTVDGAIEWHYFDTRKVLGGFYLMVVVPLVEDWMAALQPDEEWDFSDEYTRPEGVGPVPLERVTGLHFGVVTADVVASMNRYADIFALDTVSFFEIGTPGATPKARAPMVELGNATYYGAPVDHRLLSTLTQVADFGFEVLQVTVPPIHYKEDFFDVVGEGIHHFYATELASEQEWLGLDAWMRSLGVPMVQSGQMNCGTAKGLGEYFYWDTRERLGGFVLEVIVAKDGFWESFADTTPTFTRHFSTSGS